MPTASEVERFKAKLSPAGECILWTAAKNQYGYGVFRRESRGSRGKLVLAHRFYYTEILGLEIPDGYDLDHLCVTPACVSCTEPVTHQVNCQRAVARRRAAQR